MSDQYATAPQIALEAPTPVATEFEEYRPPSPRSLPMSISSSASSSRQSMHSSSLSSSYRHHPYSSSVDSHRPRSSRSRSATSASEQEQSDWSEGLASEMEMDAGQTGHLGLFNFALDPLPPLPPLPSLPSPIDTSANTSATASPQLSTSEKKKSKGKGKAEKEPKAKAKISHARKTPPGHIKRPPNAFIIFRSHCCAPNKVGPDGVIPPGTPTAQQLAELGITDHRHISRIVSHLWKSLKPGEKAYWEALAQRKKDEHAAAHPDYRYKPVFRNKDEVRRRRKVGLDETEEERLACEKLASELLGIDVAAKAKADAEAAAKKPKRAGRGNIKPAGQTATGQQRWTIDTVADALRTQELPLQPPPVVPKRRAPRRKAAAAPAKTHYAEFDDSHDDEDDDYDPYPRPQQQQQVHSAYVDQSSRTYAPQPNGEFARPYYQTRRESHTRTQATQGPQESYQFGFMHQLDELMAQQTAIVDPRQLDSAPSSRPHTASYHDAPSLSPQEHLERASSTRKGPPAPLELPYNPQFVGFPTSATLTPAPSSHSTDSFGRPPSPRSLAIRQMQHYSLSAASTTTSTAPTPRPASPVQSSASPQPSSHSSAPPTDSNHVVISPTSRTFSFSDLGPGLPRSIPLRRESEFGPSAAAIMGMKRRGTLRATGTEGGDLMLISPVTGTFGGRKFSLGRWELPRRSIAGVVGGMADATMTSALSNELLQSFELDPSFIEYLESQPVAPFGDIAAQLDALMADGEAGLGGAMIGEDDRRPGTGVSDYSDRPDTARSDNSHDGSPVLRQEDSGAGAAFWRRASVANKEQQQFQYSLQAPAEEPYHIGQDSFFNPPADPLQRPQASYSTQRSSGVPAFGSFGFGGSFQPAAHSQSLDAQLAASASDDRHHPYYSQQQHRNSILEHSPHLAQADWTARRDRGSDATIRGRQDSIRDLSQRHEEALRVLQSQLADPESQLMQQDPNSVPEGVDPNLKYCYLTPEQAKDARLVEHIFRLGYGVSFEREPQLSDASQHQQSSQQQHDYPQHHSIPSY